MPHALQASASKYMDIISCADVCYNSVCNTNGNSVTYVLGTVNTNVCPAERWYIGSEADCRAAAFALNLTFSTLLNSPTAPRFCSAAFFSDDDQRVLQLARHRRLQHRSRTRLHDVGVQLAG